MKDMSNAKLFLIVFAIIFAIAFLMYMCDGSSHSHSTSTPSAKEQQTAKELHDMGFY